MDNVVDMKRVNRPTNASSSSQDEVLPQHWVVRQSKSRGGKIYYFNTITGLSSWKHPSKGSDKGSNGRKNSETSSRASLGDVAPVIKKKKGDSVTEKKTQSRHGSPNKRKNKVHQSLSPAGWKHTGVKLGSPTRVNRIFSWVSHVNNAYEPTEQGSVLSSHCSNTDFELPDCVEDVLVQSEPRIPDTGNSTGNSGNTKKHDQKWGNTHQGKVKGGNSESASSSHSRKAKTVVGRDSVWNKPAATTFIRPKVRPKSQLPRKQQSEHWARPTLQIPKTCDNNGRHTHVVVPVTPFSPVSPEPPPVIGTQSHQVPSSFHNAPVYFTPQAQLVTQSVPMTVDSEVPSRTAEPSFPETSSSNTHTTYPVFHANTPNLPENAVGFHENSSHSPNTAIPNAPVGSFPAGGLQSNYGNFSNGPVDAARNTSQFTSEDCEIGMDIDYQELEAQIRVELQEIRSSLVINAAKVQARAEEVTHRTHSYSDTLYIVLDTNVLLSHLKFVAELRDYPIQGTGRPTLVVPWIVMQELDSLKSDAWKIRRGKIVTSQNKNGQIGVDTLARQAIRFLHSCLENNHPRVRGQTLEEVSELMGNFPGQCNDDQILQCCLLFQRKAESGSAVLFSNDQNLCSKAIINGIKAFSHQTLTSGLKSLFQNNAVVLKQTSFTEYNNELALQRRLAEKRAKADDIICELQCVLREGLSVAVETEMRAAYDNLWEDIVYIKPPWTLKDLLQLLDKHWIAVFGLVLRRDVKATVEELKKSFRVEKGNPGCLANSSKILEQAHKLFSAFSTRSSYNDAITKCMAAVVVLQKKCQEYQMEPLSPPVPFVVARAPALGAPDSAVPATPSCNGESKSGGSDEKQDSNSISSADINTINAPHPHGVVLSTFEMIWSAVKQFSDQIFAALDYRPNTQLLENVPKPSPEQAVQFLGRLCPCLACLVTALQSVLKIPVEKGIEDIQLFQELAHAVARFLDEILSSQSKVAVGDLCRFWQDPDTRTSLIQGLCQLDRALAMLQHCASLVAAS